MLFYAMIFCFASSILVTLTEDRTRSSLIVLFHILQHNVSTHEIFNNERPILETPFFFNELQFASQHMSLLTQQSKPISNCYRNFLEHDSCLKESLQQLKHLKHKNSLKVMLAWAIHSQF